MSHQPEDSADAIVVAAGGSTRMGGADKLLARIDGRPLLAHTIAAIAAADEVGPIVVVTTDERRRALVAGGWVDADRTTFVEGGPRRQDSVRAGFAALERAVPTRPASGSCSSTTGRVRASARR